MRILLKSAKISAANFSKSVPRNFSKKFCFQTQHASEIGNALDAGKLLEHISVPLRLSGLKALHASWLVKLCDFLTSEREHEVIKIGWKASAVYRGWIHSRK